MLRKTSFGTGHQRHWTKFSPNVHPHWITGCKGQLVAVEISCWQCSREGDTAVFACSACACYFCTTCAEQPVSQCFESDVNFTTPVSTLLKQAIGMSHESARDMLDDSSRCNEERRTIVAAQVFLQRHDVAHHTFWLDVVPTLPPRVLMRHLSWLFGVRLHKWFEQPTASDTVWCDEVDRYKSFFELDDVELPRCANWLETASQGTQSQETRDISSTVSGAACNRYNINKSLTGKLVTPGSMKSFITA